MKLLIIDDNYEDYEMIKHAAEQYPLTIYPANRAQAMEFQKQLDRYGKRKSPESLAYIEKEMSSFRPDVIFLDINLVDPGRDGDRSGELLRQTLIDEKFPDARICVMTSFSRNEIELTAGDSYIYKYSFTGLQHEVEQYCENVLHLNRGSEAAGFAIEQEAATGSTQDNGLTKKTSLQRFAILLEKPREWIKLVLDVLIKLTFFAGIAATAGLGFYKLFYYVWNEENVIRTAEHVFVIFLPMLILFSLYVFYSLALSSFITGGRNVYIDFESASKLMRLTKQLFISSLISYLFIKLIELLTENTVADPSSRYLRDPVTNEVTNSNPVTHYLHGYPVLHLSLVAGCIVVLIAFYIFLTNHKEPHKSS